MSTIDTARVAGRRPLHFSSLDEVLIEADRLAAADRAGTLTRLGNWTLGQAFAHLAAWMSYPYEGYPPQLRPPWFIRVFLKFQKTRFLSRSLPAGFKIPKIPGGTLGADPVSTSEGLDRLRRAAARLAASPPSIPNPIFGPMSHAEWVQGHLRHSELHLSFFIPEPS